MTNATQRANLAYRAYAFISDGLALVSTIALVVALTMLAQSVVEDSATYALVVTDDAGAMWVIDYAMSYDDCRNERARYALGVAQCDASKG